MYSPAWPHSEIKEVFPDIFFVMGTNITHYNNTELQHSRNMIIIRNENKLSLINSVRLTQEGLDALNALGTVENVIMIGAFHGRDDMFYLDHYHAKLWALDEMKHDNRVADVILIPKGNMPFPKCSLFVFETSIHPEGAFHLDQEGGILVTCDSIKNWLAPDSFFSTETTKLYADQGFFGAASISNVWKQACQTKLSDFVRLKALKFHHLLSAHGDPLFNNAHELVTSSIDKAYSL